MYKDYNGTELIIIPLILRKLNLEFYQIIIEFHILLSSVGTHKHFVVHRDNLFRFNLVGNKVK